MSLSRTTKPTYTLPALQKYLSHISHPAPHTKTLLSNISKKDWATSSSALSSLTTLQKYQQAKIPFANLYLHYSKHHIGTLAPANLYEYIINSSGIAREGEILSISEILNQKNVGARGRGSSDYLTEREKKWIDRGPSGGRGGSCTLNNGFFGTILRSLGMSTKQTGARVALAANGGPKGVFAGWNHLVNLVSFEGERYLVDVGFGGNGPTAPVKLVDGNEMFWGSTGDKVRVIWRGINGFEDLEERCWVLQHRREGKQEWEDIYCFTSTEFTDSDVEVMNWKTARDIRGSFFNQMIICLRNEMEGEDVVGTIIMTGGKVKRRIRGKNEMLRECKSEVERWETLEEYFGIVLGEQERVGIKGLVTELKAPPPEED